MGLTDIMQEMQDYLQGQSAAEEEATKLGYPPTHFGVTNYNDVKKTITVI